MTLEPSEARFFFLGGCVFSPGLFISPDQKIIFIFLFIYLIFNKKVAIARKGAQVYRVPGGRGLETCLIDEVPSQLITRIPVVSRRNCPLWPDLPRGDRMVFGDGC